MTGQKGPGMSDDTDNDSECADGKMDIKSEDVGTDYDGVTEEESGSEEGSSSEGEEGESDEEDVESDAEGGIFVINICSHG